MCGRIFQTLPLHRLIAIARAAAVTNAERYSSSYNVCPTTFIPAIRTNRKFGATTENQEKRPTEKSDNEQKEGHQENGEKIENQQKEGAESTKIADRELTWMHWGHTIGKNLVINGKVDELAPTFKKLIHKNRCVVILQGYFEWHQKNPYLLKSKTEDHLMAAAVYTESGDVVILTKAATPELQKIHHRMPVILSPEDVEVWLDPKNDDQILRVVENCLICKEKAIWKDIGITKLGPHVSNQSQKSAKCIMTYQEYKKELDKTGIMRFFKPKEPKKDVVIDKSGETVQVSPGTIDKTDQKGELKESKKRDLPQ